MTLRPLAPSSGIFPRTFRSALFSGLSRVVVLGGIVTLPAQRLPAQLPETPTVVHGQVEVKTDGTNMTVKQDSQFGIVNWNSFSVGAGQGVHFANGSGATLNRVTGLTPSQIDGTLTATGSLFLLNKNGVIIGTDGRVLTGGSFIASTRDIADADFLNGGGFSLTGDSTAGVTNLGKISSLGGDVLLAGYTVENHGSIDAPAGRVGLAAGQRIDVLTDVSWLDGAYAVSLGERGNDVTNTGRLQSLVAELRTHNGNIYALAGNNTGLIQATGVKNEGGKVILTAEGGTVQSTGTITATRADAAGRTNGGDITIDAGWIENFGGVQDVSGATGGTIKLTGGSITTDTTMLARGTAGAGGTLAFAATTELLATAGGRFDAGGTNRGGAIALDAGAGVLVFSGQAQAAGSLGAGGEIVFGGDRVMLLGGTADAGGATGGGTIAVGGGLHGGGIWSDAAASPLAAWTNSRQVFVSDKTVLSADATGPAGAGGQVTVWSDGTTEFAGTISARGGFLRGDGGVVETSGLEGLGVGGTVDAGARGAGIKGSWLLDPKNITIGAAATDPINQLRTLLSPGTSTGATAFGYVALDVEGDTYVIGDQYYGALVPLTAMNEGRFLVYDQGVLAAAITSGAINTRSSVTGLFGRDVAISNNRIAAVSSSSAYLFVKGAGWQNGSANLASSYRVEAGGATPSLGYFSIAIDGNSVVAGAPFSNFGWAGAIDAFTIDSNNNLSAPARLRASIWQGGVVPDAFGYRVAVSGNTIAATFFNNWNFYNDVLTGSASKIILFERGSSSSSWSGAGQTILSIAGSLQGTENGFGFGRSLALSGNTLVAGYEAGSGDISTGRGVYVFEKNGTWAASTTPVARLTGVGLGFGYSVDTDGTRIVVSAPNSANRGTSGLTFDPVYVFDRGSGWANGQANLTATLAIGTPVVSSIALGYTVAVDGNHVLAGNIAGQASSPANVAVYDFAGPFEFTNRISYASNPSGSFNISATSLAGTLSRGTDITLQANNDITISSAITVNNAAGNGGALSLFAGRDVLVNASIFTDNGKLTLYAGDPLANATYRDAGEKVVVLGRDSNNASVTLNTGTADLIIAAADRFENRTGSTNPFLFASTNPGRFLVYSKTPDQSGASQSNNLTSDIATVGRDWFYYNKSFDATAPVPSWLPAGDGFIYSVQPTVQVGVGDATITYGQAASASLSLTGLTLGGNAISGSVFGVTASDLPNLVTAGLANSVPLNTGGFAHAGTYTGGLTAAAKATVTTGSVFGVAVSTGAAGNLTVNRARLDVAPANATRAYRDADPAFTAVYTGFVTGDTAAVIDTPVAITSNATASSGIGNYTLTATGGLDNDYVFNITGTGLLTIAPRDLLVTGLTGVNRTYDGTTAATYTGTPAIAPLGGDSVTLAGVLTATASFADKNVGTAKPITLSGLSLNGAAAANYRLVLPANLTASITPATLTFSGLVAQNRTYDRTTAATLTGTATIAPFGSDAVTLTGTPVATFADKNAGTAKAVTVTGLSLTGADAFNYTLAAPTLTATISPYSLTVTGLVAQNRDYDATLGATVTGTPSITPLAGDTVAISGLPAGAYADKNAGLAKAVTVTGLSLTGTDAANYTLTYPALTSNINPAPLTLAGLTGVDRIYDATTRATVTGTITFSAFAGDTVVIVGTPTATFTDKAVATGAAITVTGLTLSGADAANYVAIQPTGVTASILTRPISVTDLFINNKVYDGTTTATATGTPVFGGIIAGDDATFHIASSGPTFSFTDKNVGTGKSVTIGGVSLTGFDAPNYDPTRALGLLADITAASLRIVGASATSRVYDATTGATVSGGSLSGVFGSDLVVLDASGAAGTFADKNAGLGKSVTAFGYTLSGADALNYTLLQPTGLTAAITPFNLTILGLSGDKTYDGTTAAPLTSTGFDAVFKGDTVTLDTSAVTATYADKNAGANKAITLSGLFALSGTDGANYSVTQPTSLTGTIARRGITVSGLTIADKIYDGTTAGQISGTGTFGGAIAGDDLSINVGATTITFADKNVGTNKAIALSGVTLSGADADNYTAATPTGITASILAKDLTVTGLTALDKTYDRTATATLAGTGSLVGTIATDVLSLDESARAGLFADKNAGTAKSVAVSGLVLTGTDALNYHLVAPTLTASIARADVAVLGLSAVNRLYDATVVAPLTGTATLDFGLLANVLASSEHVTLAGTATGAFADKNIGAAKAITVGGLTLTGADAANYNLRLPTKLTANVTPATIQVTGAAITNKVYDATATATFASLGSVAVFGSDNVQLGGTPVATFADKNVGVLKTATASGYALTGTDAANYLLLQPTGLAATITRADLSLTGVIADAKIYDGTTAAPLSGSLNLSPLGHDTVSVAGAPSATFADKNVGTAKTVSLAGLSLTGADAANYNLLVPTLAADITPRTVTVSGLTAVSRTYDGTTTASLTGTPALQNTIPGDNLGFNLAAITATFANKNVGTNKLVTLVGNALTGGDAPNYSLSLPAGLTASITAKLLQIIGVDAVDRTYDRTTAVALTGGTLSGAVASDTVSLVTSSATGATADKNAGVNKPVTASGYTLTGSDAANYAIAQPTGVDVTIFAKLLDVSGLQVADKFFDGTTTATASGGTLSGVINGDDVAFVTTSGRANFADASVGLNKPVALTGYTLGGADAANYKIPAPLAATGNILQSLAIITDIIPAEVLKANANAELDKQRQSLAAFNAKQQDLVTVVDYSTQVSQAATGIAVPSVNPALLAIPPDQLDPETARYLAAADAAKAAAEKAQQLADDYRNAAAAYKQTGQNLNAVERALETETGLRDTFVARIAAVDAELAKSRANLATIDEAKRRIETLTAQMTDAARLGRGSEAGQYEKAIADARAIIAGEAAARAQFDQLSSAAQDARNQLAASEAKVASLTQQKAALSSDFTAAGQKLQSLGDQTSAAKLAAAAAVDQLEQARTTAEAATRDRLAEADAKLAATVKAAPTGLKDAVDQAMKDATAAAERYPLSPERAQIVNDAKTAAAAAVAAVDQRIAEKREFVAQADATLKAAPPEVSYYLYSGPAAKTTRGLSSEEIAKLDPKSIGSGIPFTQLLGGSSSEVVNLAATATAVNDSLQSLGQLNPVVVDGRLQAPKLELPNLNVNTYPNYGLKDIDQPLKFDPASEQALKNSFQNAGVLPKFTNPALANLPVTQQLHLQELMGRAAAKQAELIKGGMDPNEAARQSFDKQTNDLMAMVLMEGVDKYGIGDIPGVQEFVSGAIGELSAQYGISPSGLADNLMAGNLKGVAGSGADVVKNIAGKAQQIVTNPAQAGVQIAKDAYNIVKAGGEAFIGAWTGGGSGNDKAAQQQAADEARRAQFAKVAAQLAALEDRRQNAIAARDQDLVQIKNLLVTNAQRNEAAGAIPELQSEKYRALATAAAVAKTELREQVTDALSTTSANAPRSDDPQIAAAQAQKDKLAAQLAALSQPATGGK